MDADLSQVYPVREDTLLLLGAALAEARPSDRVLELGTGSGYIARHLAGKVALMVATDVNFHACLAATSYGVEIARTDLTAGIRGQFDLVLFNPPYLPTTPEERLDDLLEMALDGGPSGREVIARLLPDLPRVLAPGGKMLLVISELTGEEDVLDLFAKSGFTAGINRRTLIEGEELMVVKAVSSLELPPARRDPVP